MFSFTILGGLGMEILLCRSLKQYVILEVDISTFYFDQKVAMTSSDAHDIWIGCLFGIQWDILGRGDLGLLLIAR